MGEEETSETPEIGFLGAGEWPQTQFEGLNDASRVYDVDYSLSSVQDIRPEEDIDWIQDVDTEYFRDEDITNEPQDGFLDDLDLVYVANRIDQHPEQINNLIEEIDEQDLSTSIAVEKALSPEKEEHYELIDKAKDYGVEIGLIDHYAFKPQARKLEASIYDEVWENGRITEANFIAREKSDSNDQSRKWVFEEEVGGIGMDWLPHLYSVMIGRLGARFEEEDVQELEAEPANYDTEFLDEDTPAAVKVESPVSGLYFADDAVVRGEVGKRYDEKEKKIRLEYENGETREWELTDNVVGVSSNTYAALSLLDMASDIPNEHRDDPALDGMNMVYNALKQVNQKPEVEAPYMD